METTFLKYNYSLVYEKLRSGEMSFDEFLEFTNYIYEFGKNVGHSYGRIDSLKQIMKVE